MKVKILDVDIKSINTLENALLIYEWMDWHIKYGEWTIDDHEDFSGLEWMLMQAGSIPPPVYN